MSFQLNTYHVCHASSWMKALTYSLRPKLKWEEENGVRRRGWGHHSDHGHAAHSQALLLKFYFCVSTYLHGCSPHSWLVLSEGMRYPGLDLEGRECVVLGIKLRPLQEQLVPLTWALSPVSIGSSWRAEPQCLSFLSAKGNGPVTHFSVPRLKFATAQRYCYFWLWAYKCTHRRYCWAFEWLDGAFFIPVTASMLSVPPLLLQPLPTQQNRSRTTNQPGQRMRFHYTVLERFDWGARTQNLPWKHFCFHALVRMER